MYKYLLFTALGMFLMYIILRILSSRVTSTHSQSNEVLFRLLASPKVANLLKTNEAKEVIKSTEFKNFIKTLTNDQIIAMSRSLTQYEPKL